MTKAVANILTQIEKLGLKDRLLLDRKLTEKAEREWRKEAMKARRIARAQGITDEKIDQIIEELRYGK